MRVVRIVDDYTPNVEPVVWMLASIDLGPALRSYSRVGPR